MAAWLFNDFNPPLAKMVIVRDPVGCIGSKLISTLLQGTRRFQSVAVLESPGRSLAYLHDYLDDLESFFYVLCHLILLYDAPGIISPANEAALARWQRDDLQVVADAKGAFLSKRTREVSAWWGDAGRTLLSKFQALMNEIVDDKCHIIDTRTLTPEAKLERLAVMNEEFNVHYEAVIKLFDNALAQIENEDAALEFKISPQLSNVNSRIAVMATHTLTNTVTRTTHKCLTDNCQSSGRPAKKSRPATRLQDGVPKSSTTVSPQEPTPLRRRLRRRKHP